MSATERIPEIIAEERLRELERQVAEAGGQLDAVRAATKDVQHRIDRCLRDPHASLWRVLVGALTLPLLAFAGVCLTCAVIGVLSQFR